MASRDQEGSLIGRTPEETHDPQSVTLTATMQQHSLIPGFFFCKFAAGVVETSIRAFMVVVLLLLICLAAAVIHESGGGFSVNFIILGAVLLLTIDIIMLLLHFLNPRHFNNNYTVYYKLDIIKCFILAIGMFLACYFELNAALRNYCEYKSSHHVCTKTYQLAIVVVAIAVICITLILVEFVWDIVFLVYKFGSKIPMTGHYQHIQHQGGI